MAAIAFPTHLVSKKKVVGLVLLHDKNNVEIAVQANGPFPIRHNVIPYYEVRIEELHPQGCVAVGFARQGFPDQKILPGWIEGSYGYHGDDGRVFSGDGQRGEAFGPAFRAGDVVGLGIDPRSRTMYATLNGRLLGAAIRNVQLDPPSTAPLVPTIGVDYPAKISVNFGTTPFVFRQSLSLHLQLSPPTTAALRRSVSGGAAASSDPVATFDDLPNEVVAIVVDFVANTPAQAVVLGKVSKTFYGLTMATSKSAVANGVWRRLAKERWPHITAPVAARVDDWYNLYNRRAAVQPKSDPASEKDPVIENCLEWKFKCPVALSKLQRTEDRKIDHCTQCKESVFLCEDIEELKMHVEQGHCVAIDFSKSVASARKPVSRKRGKVVAGRR